jgi:predicted RNA-binding Zn-ribbon protein involved in translation (DUF1610 family)
MSDRRIVVCRAVDDSKVQDGDPQTVGGAQVRRCAGCGCEIWVAPSTVTFLIPRLGEHWDLLCNKCADPILSSDEEKQLIMPGPAAMRELAEAILSDALRRTS